MSIPTFAAQKKAWSSPPVDDIGYIPAKELLAMPDDTFVATMTRSSLVGIFQSTRRERELDAEKLRKVMA